MVNAILAKRVNHIVTKGDNPAWPKGSKSRGFSSVKKRRKELNLTQEQLADEVGFSNTFISERESGIKRYNISHLNKLAIALKCSPKDFLPNEPFKEDAKK